MAYSIKHKMLVPRKVLPPSSMSVNAVSKDTGISVQTIYKWMYQVENDTLVAKMAKETESRFKNRLGKFTLLLGSKTVPEEHFGEWL